METIKKGCCCATKHARAERLPAAPVPLNNLPTNHSIPRPSHSIPPSAFRSTYPSLHTVHPLGVHPSPDAFPHPSDPSATDTTLTPPSLPSNHSAPPPHAHTFTISPRQPTTSPLPPASPYHTSPSSYPHPSPSSLTAEPTLYDVQKLLANGCVIVTGAIYNSDGHRICGVLNQHDKPCRRIGKCPFHLHRSPLSASNSINGVVDAFGNVPVSITPAASSPSIAPSLRNLTASQPQIRSPAIPRKRQYKHGWTREEHYLFLEALAIYGRGCWKETAAIVGTRLPTQVQSHAQKFFKRGEKRKKVKRSIHDLGLESKEMKQVSARLRADPSPTARSCIQRINAAKKEHERSQLLHSNGQQRVRTSSANPAPVAQLHSLVQSFPTHSSASRAPAVYNTEAQTFAAPPQTAHFVQPAPFPPSFQLQTAAPIDAEPTAVYGCKPFALPQPPPALPQPPPTLPQPPPALPQPPPALPQPPPALPQLPPALPQLPPALPQLPPALPQPPPALPQPPPALPQPPHPLPIQAPSSLIRAPAMRTTFEGVANTATKGTGLERAAVDSVMIMNGHGKRPLPSGPTHEPSLYEPFDSIRTGYIVGIPHPTVPATNGSNVEQQGHVFTGAHAVYTAGQLTGVTPHIMASDSVKRRRVDVHHDPFASWDPTAADTTNYGHVQGARRESDGRFAARAGMPAARTGGVDMFSARNNAALADQLRFQPTFGGAQQQNATTSLATGRSGEAGREIDAGFEWKEKLRGGVSLCSGTLTPDRTLFHPETRRDLRHHVTPIYSPPYTKAEETGLQQSKTLDRVMRASELAENGMVKCKAPFFFCLQWRPVIDNLKG
ncbi:Myb-like protein J [Gracilariopsis chorda]|uniref:Myb-like protein J n=1 Tax=Gracilariopsis chorda TaxID=448386 RepID=A0A2V3J3V6_9FLOR|nr:Myb-like protein J [Gracilariopsis chorda]|eukprot:PXF49075.1 Myb-like protein J [Gracilariopsis chorda]